MPGGTKTFYRTGPKGTFARWKGIKSWPVLAFLTKIWKTGLRGTIFFQADTHVQYCSKNVRYCTCLFSRKISYGGRGEYFYFSGFFFSYAKNINFLLRVAHIIDINATEHKIHYPWIYSATNVSSWKIHSLEMLSTFRNDLAGRFNNHHHRFYLKIPFSRNVFPTSLF